MEYTLPIEFRVDWAYMFHAVYPPGVPYDTQHRKLAPSVQLLLRHATNSNKAVRVLFQGVVAGAGLKLPDDGPICVDVTYLPGSEYEGEFYVTLDDDESDTAFCATTFDWWELELTPGA